MVFGAMNIFKETNQSYLEVLKDNILTSIVTIIIVLASIGVLQYVIFFFRYDGIELLLKKLQFQQEIGVIFELLDEAIIAKGANGVSFVNKKGFEIIRNIQLTLNIAGVTRHEGGSISDNSGLPELLKENKYIFTAMDQNNIKTEEELEIEDMFMKAKIFEIQELVRNDPTKASPK